MQFGLKQTVAPTIEPITLDEALGNTKVEVAEENTLVNNLIKLVREHAERETGYQLMPATWRMYLEAFKNEIILPRPPLSSVSSITYVDTAGATQTVAASVYAVSTGREPGRIWLGYNQTWPTVRGFKEDIVVEYVAGYGVGQAVPQTFVPQMFKQAMLMVLDQMYNVRSDTVEAAIAEMPNSSRQLLAGLWHGSLAEEMVA